jgi:hypothetical protein
MNIAGHNLKKIIQNGILPIHKINLTFNVGLYKFV